jgi:hypothetical protein
VFQVARQDISVKMVNATSATRPHVENVPMMRLTARVATRLCTTSLRRDSRAQKLAKNMESTPMKIQERAKNAPSLVKLAREKASPARNVSPILEEH